MVPRKHILVVEDNELNRAMLCEILTELYWRPETARKR